MMRRLWMAALLALACSTPAHANWVATGNFKYQDRPFGPAGFTGNIVDLPIRGAVVQVVDQNTQAVLAAGGTDTLGNFSIPVTDSQSRPVYVRAISYTADSTLYHLQVRASLGGALFAVASAALPNHDPGANLNFNGGSPMVAPAHSVGEAFNILDCLENGIDFVAAVNGARPDGPLHALWNATSLDGTYFTRASRPDLPSYIHLTGEDAYSDAVINHEQGHYMASIYSQDNSQGGQHFLGDNHQDMRLAWSEGWATYFGQSVRRHFRLSNPTWYADLNGESGTGAALNFSYEIETPSVTAIGGASEVSVQAALWDLVDGPSTPDVHPGVDDDPLSLPDTNTWDVFKNYLTGNGPVTIEAFWDGWFARGLGHQAEMITTFGLEKMQFFPDVYENDDFASRAVTALTDGTPSAHTFYIAGGGADADWVRFQATAGATYIIETNDLVGGADTFLQLLAAADTGSVLTSSDNRGGGDLSSRLDFAAPSTGAFLVRCSHTASSDGHTGRYGSYELRITRGIPSASTFQDVTSGSGTGNFANGRGVAWGDYNNDGYPDLYVCNTGGTVGTGQVNRLYRNQAGSSFSEVAATVGVQAGVEEHEGAAWGDFDNDGYLDLAVVSVGGIHLFRNVGAPDFNFADVTQAAGLIASGSGRTVNWVDYDGDGYLDLFVVNYGAASRLWHNNHNGTFTAVTVGLELNAHSFSAAWTDYDHDGRPDVALGIDGDVDGQSVRLFHQGPAGQFEEVTGGAGLTGASGRIFGLAWGDYDGDGFADLVACNETGLNLLYHNRGDGSFEERAHAANIEGGFSATSPAWLDVDNDGDLDLYVTNFGNPTNMFDNLTGGSFTLSTQGSVSAASRAVAAADFNRDGAMDLYVSTQSSNSLLQGVPVAGNHYLELRLRGRQSNRTAIGARVMMAAGSRRAWREVNGGQAWGCQPMQTLHFGLGTAAQADSVVIYWPSRKVTHLVHVPGDVLVNADEDTTSSVDTTVTAPAAAALRQNYPNPFKGETRIRFDVPRGAASRHVRLAVYDVAGRLERVLVDADLAPAAGVDARWDGNLSDGRPAHVGVHFYRLEVSGQALTRKLMLVR